MPAHRGLRVGPPSGAKGDSRSSWRVGARFWRLSVPEGNGSLAGPIRPARAAPSASAGAGRFGHGFLALAARDVVVEVVRKVGMRIGGIGVVLVLARTDAL